MLPEIFKVGNTMQEDFGFFNSSSCLNEKVTSSTNSSSPILTDFETNTNSLNKETEIIVSENSRSPEISKWPFNYGIHFLKTSDDPMISSIHQESVCNENELLKRNSCNVESSSVLKPSFEEISSEDVNDSTYMTDLMIKSIDSNKRHFSNKLQFHNQFSLEHSSNYESIQHKEQKLDSSTEKTPHSPKISKLHNRIKLNDIETNEEGVITWLQKMMLKTNRCEDKEKSELKSTNSSGRLKSASKEENVYKDNIQSLPYMGQMTLENMKPRRGRKPKKADICHLIYKNYGTVIPKLSSSNASPASTIKSSTRVKSHGSAVVRIPIETNNDERSKETKLSQIEPLNLCVRERTSKNSKFKNINNLNQVKVKKINEDKKTMMNFSSPILDVNQNYERNVLKTDEISKNIENRFDTMLSCHREMMNKKLERKDKILSSNAGIIQSRNENNADFAYSAECHDALNTDQCSSTSDSSSIAAMCQNQKRKRSAIFIPPVQTEFSTGNPTNEVSICKFKFTGGTKPSLQEKKILSVDAGGNFRYFSGTGDKSMRGYEFFPRENLLKSSMLAQSHTNAFLNAESQKLPLDFLPPISPDINNKLLNLSDVDSTAILDKNFVDDAENCMEEEKIEEELQDSVNISNRKRPIINRSVQRRKLEKTFKEKGFLIQTQQLQSAEGATYCKFRQLRKFTRYLFRSWKDYLPPCESKPDN